MKTSAAFTIEDVLRAKRMLADNDADPSDLDGKIYCYEWEAPVLIAGGINPEFLVIIPREIPVG